MTELTVGQIVTSTNPKFADLGWGYVQEFHGNKVKVEFIPTMFNKPPYKRLVEIVSREEIRSVKTPLQGLEEGDFDETWRFELKQRAAHLIVCNRDGQLSNSLTDLMPHQITVAHSIVSSSKRRFLIAEEVGLGKTIEAGLVILVLLQRGLAKRVLIVTPAGLTIQWKEEMEEKFGLDFLICGEEVQGVNAFNTDRLIASLETLRLDNPRKQGQSPGHKTLVLGSEPWDLIIFDEAHRLGAKAGAKRKIDKTHAFKLADEALGYPRFMGDLITAAFFSADKDRERRQKRNELLDHAIKWLEKTAPESLLEMEDALNWLRIGGPPVRPFHWELEFPEVFDRGNGGFDAIMGNPPFAGKNTLINSHRTGYLNWLKAIHVESHGNADLVAHFFRRSLALLRAEGSFGLIATNTIGQGDTRRTGLRWICTHGGTIYAARRRCKWPGQAAVVVSVVHVIRGRVTGPFTLDNRKVSVITAYLFHSGGHADPEKLLANSKKSFQGFILLGMGFTFDDISSNESVNRISEMHRLIAKDPRNAERIFPYIGGEEVNTHPTHQHHRYVIDFKQMTEEEARRWPDLLRIVEMRVKPQRMLSDRQRRRDFWWQFGEQNPGLRRAVKGLHKVLVRPLTSTHFSTFTFLPAGMIYDQSLITFTSSGFPIFSVLSSRLHQTWSIFLGSTMKDDPRYNIGNCFETFPFPEGVLETARDEEEACHFKALAAPQILSTLDRLEEIGKKYFEFRANLMIRNEEGLTKTYNRFHDPYETSPTIRRLRELHDEMDRAVLDVYGWTDLKPTCEFLLDYEDEDEEDENGVSCQDRSRRKPWQYRWPDDFRDEVLARLLELNKERAEQERLAGLAAEVGSGKPKGTARKGTDQAQRQRKKKNSGNQPNMFKLD